MEEINKISDAIVHKTTESLDKTAKSVNEIVEEMDAPFDEIEEIVARALNDDVEKRTIIVENPVANTERKGSPCEKYWLTAIDKMKEMNQETGESLKKLSSGLSKIKNKARQTLEEYDAKDAEKMRRKLEKAKDPVKMVTREIHNDYIAGTAPGQ